MKILSFSTVIALMLLLSPNSSYAQDFGLLNDLMNQLNQSQRTDFSDKLQNSDLGNLGDGLQGSGVMDSLNTLTGSATNPIGDLNDISEAWGAGNDFLGDLIDSTNNDTLNIDGLLGEYNNVNGVWNQNVDSLTNIFDQYGGNLGDGGSLDDPPGQAFDSTGSFLNNLDTVSAGGLGGTRFNNILNQLFSRNMFSDLELAYGQKTATSGFYQQSNSNSNEIQVVRVGSVPSFQNAWESRWHAATSFTDETTTTSPDGTVTTQKDYKALVLDFDYAIMYNPGFSFGSLSFRYMSGLGIESAMYVPSFADGSTARSAARVGRSTGFAPQLSTGFSLTQGDITTYAIASAAYGSVVNGNGNEYSSFKFEAGVRYSNLINVRYSVGEQNWTANLSGNGKRVNTSSQFTIGLILDSMFR